MLFEYKYNPTSQIYYNREWGVVENRLLWYESEKYRANIINGRSGRPSIDDFNQFIDDLTEHIEKKYDHAKLVC